MKQTTLLFMLAGLALNGLVSGRHCLMIPAIASDACGAIAAPPPDSEPWGDGKGLTEEQSAAIQKLAFPQRYRSIIERFGYPDARKAQVDYYKLADGRWVGLAYSEDNVAVRLIYAN